MTNSQILFSCLLLAVTCIAFIFNYKFNALKDDSDFSKQSNAPYSFARVQLAWWTIIIFSAFAACIFVKGLPNMYPSLLALLGIAGVTNIVAKVMDSKDGIGSTESKGFFADITNNGDWHRLQTVLFNVAVGGWFIVQVYRNLIIPVDATFTLQMVLPDIPPFILVLLGGSAALYLGGKKAEA